MTKITNIQNKTELLNLTAKLSDELVVIQGEIDSIKTKFGSISNYDGLNFEGAATIISSNLTNILSSMETLSGNLTSYVTNLSEFDQYDNPMVDDELIAPDIIPPDEIMKQPSEEKTIEDIKSEEDSSVIIQNPPVSETEKTSEDTKSEEDNSVIKQNSPISEIERPSEEQKSEEKPKEESTSKSESQSHRTPTSEFVPEQLSASEAIIIQNGDVNVDISKFTNNDELGYTVTVGNTSYILGENDFDLLCAIIEAESDGTYDGTLAVATTILNRCENADYQKMYGLDPIAQITAINQFDGYTSGEFKKYLNNNSNIVVEAVKSALAGVRNHKLCTLSN